MDQIYKYMYGGNFIDDFYLCDSKSILANQIKKYNDSELNIDSDSFNNIDAKEKRVKDLLREDFEELVKHNPTLLDFSSIISFEESDVCEPEIVVVTEKIASDSKGNKSELHYVIVSRNKLRLIFNAIAKLDMVCKMPKTLEALQEYHTTLESKEWADSEIYKELIKEICNIKNGPLKAQGKFPYIYSPYDLCEYVDGARKFMVAHEVAHIARPGFYSLPQFTEERVSEIWDPNIVHPMFGIKNMEELKTLGELTFDSIALDYIIAPLYRKDLVQDDVYEVGNHLVGMRFYFNILFLIEALNTPKNSLHPFSLWREMHAIDHLVEKHFRIIEKYPEIADGQVNFGENIAKLYSFFGISEDRNDKVNSMGEHRNSALKIESAHAGIYSWLFKPDWAETMSIFQKYYGSMKKLIDISSKGRVSESKYRSRVFGFVAFEKLRVIIYGMERDIPPDEIMCLVEYVQIIMNKSESV